MGPEEMRALRSEGQPGEPPADAATLIAQARAAERATRHAGQAVTTTTILRGGAPTSR